MSYRTADRGKTIPHDTQELARFLVRNGQALLPMVELIEQSRLAVDELIDVLGRAQIEAVLRLSAEGVAGPPHQGKRGGTVGWHGNETGTVALRERKLRGRRPRLRRKGRGAEKEVPVPAYQMMQQDERLGPRMLEILLRGVSTRQYAGVLPEMAETVGVSRSSVSREGIQASESMLRQLCERRFDDLDLLILYLDGLRFGDHHLVAAVGVDPSPGRSKADACREVLGQPVPDDAEGATFESGGQGLLHARDELRNRISGTLTVMVTAVGGTADPPRCERKLSENGLLTEFVYWPPAGTEEELRAFIEKHPILRD